MNKTHTLGILISYRYSPNILELSKEYITGRMLKGISLFRICSWYQPVLMNEGTVSCSRKQWEPLMGFSTHDWQITSQTPSTQHRCLITHRGNCFEFPLSGLIHFVFNHNKKTLTINHRLVYMYQVMIFML